MIEVLKKVIEEKIGSQIKSRGDCELLSNAITVTLDKDISCSTLRRFYGLAPNTKPNSKTLNTLAQFIGYKNYADFTQKYLYKEKIDLSQITYKTVSDGDEQAILDLVKTTKRSPENFIGFIVMLTRELFHIKNYRLIDALFKLEELSYTSFSYSEVLYFGNSIGLLLREQTKVDYILLHNMNFLNCIYLTFVDYSSLNSYYGKWATYLKSTKLPNEIILFNNALLQYKNFLNNKTVKTGDQGLIYNKDLHPILCSRLLALKFLSKNKCDVTEVLTNYYKTHTKIKYTSDYSYELYTTAILIKNKEIMIFLIEREDFKIAFLHQKHHLNSFYLMSAFYYKLTKNKVEELKNFNRFSLKDCRYSYEEFIQLIYLIYLYDDSKVRTEKNQILMRYKALSEKLNYPYFSEDFLLKYFD